MTEAAETEEKKLSPRVESQDVGPCKIKLRIEVGAERVKELIDDKYRELNESVALPGFRKGHAPRNLLERKFGKALLDDLKLELIHRSFEEAREERKLEPVGDPQVQDGEKLALEEGKPFAYEIVLEVRPNFEVKNYEGIRVKKPRIRVEDAEVNQALEAFRESKAELVPAEDPAARLEDQVIADLVLVADGKEIDRAENNDFILGPNIFFYGKPLPDFHTVLLGKKPGDEVEYRLTLPDDFVPKEYAGKEALVRATIKGIKRKRLPALDDEFARKHFDMDNLEELRRDVRKRLEREKEAQAREQMAEQVVEEIVKANDFPMPEGLIESGAEEALRRMHLEMALRGASEEEIEKSIEQEKSRSREQMARALKEHFILENLARKEKIFVTEDQVEERVAQMAARAGRWPHEMRAYLEEQGLMSLLRRRMREDLVREFLLSKAVIEEEAE